MPFTVMTATRIVEMAPDPDRLRGTIMKSGKLSKRKSAFGLAKVTVRQRLTAGHRRGHRRPGQPQKP